MTQFELIRYTATCQHPAEAFADEGVCIICKGHGLQLEDELRLFREHMEAPRMQLPGEGKVIRARRWWRQFWA
jgi:hypothetical protein